MEVAPVTLEGRFVRLEPLDRRHAEALAEAASEDLFAYHFPPAELTPEGFAAQIEGLRTAPAWLPFAPVLRETDRAVGVTCYLDIQPHNRALEIGFTWIGKPWQGTAVNPESKYLLLQHAFETLGALRVQLKTDLRNIQSQAALSKLGAVREGLLRKQMVMPDGHQRDTVMFSITDDEWPDVRRALEERLSRC
jgi:RimJ/RimL family protein N-acetyltransferase